MSAREPVAVLGVEEAARHVRQVLRAVLAAAGPRQGGRRPTRGPCWPCRPTATRGRSGWPSCGYAGVPAGVADWPLPGAHRLVTTGIPVWVVGYSLASPPVNRILSDLDSLVTVVSGLLDDLGLELPDRHVRLRRAAGLAAPRDPAGGADRHADAAS